ncbi:MAG: hypothetical protein JOZ18_06930 [Chloroflexi bacterium]|nr:hypothetical protein [Chloroflexota bacterium]
MPCVEPQLIEEQKKANALLLLSVAKYPTESAIPFQRGSAEQQSLYWERRNSISGAKRLGTQQKDSGWGERQSSSCTIFAGEPEREKKLFVSPRLLVTERGYPLG